MRVGKHCFGVKRAQATIAPASMILASSSRRKPGSRLHAGHWIPAFAGMTVVGESRLAFQHCDEAVPNKRCQVNKQSGFSYLVLIFVVAIFGIGLGVVVPIWSEIMKQDREAALIERAGTIVRGIRAYTNSTLAGKRQPNSLNELLEDRRSGSLRRHLRSIPLDPVTGSTTWGLVRDASGGIVGVYSLSTQKPLRDQLPDGATGPTPALQYDEWQFLISTPALPSVAKG